MVAPYKNTIKHTVDLTNAWIDELDEKLDWDDQNRTYRFLKFTLQALRDILPPDEAAQLSAQLPLLIRGMYYEGYSPSKTDYVRHDLEAFLERLAHMMKPDVVADPEIALTEVFILLNKHVSAGEIEDVRGNLRRKFKDLWPSVPV